MSYYFHPGAETEHFEAISFYESRQRGLGAAYLTDFEALVANIIHMPHRYRVERMPNIRSVSLQQFPFKIIFRDLEGIVQILAVAHKRRRPDYWLNRL